MQVSPTTGPQKWLLIRLLLCGTRAFSRACLLISAGIQVMLPDVHLHPSAADRVVWRIQACAWAGAHSPCLCGHPTTTDVSNLRALHSVKR